MYRYEYKITSNGTRLRSTPSTEFPYVGLYNANLIAYGNEIITHSTTREGIWYAGDMWLKVEKIGDTLVNGYMAIKHLGVTAGLLVLVVDNGNTEPTPVPPDLDFNINLIINNGILETVTVDGERFVKQS